MLIDRRQEFMSLHISVVMTSTVTLCCIMRVRTRKMVEKLQVYTQVCLRALFASAHEHGV